MAKALVNGPNAFACFGTGCTDSAGGMDPKRTPRNVARAVRDALSGHAGAAAGIAGVVITAGALGIAIGVAETERETPRPAFADNLWFNLGVALAVLSVLLAVGVLVSMIDRSVYARRLGLQLLRGRNIRRRCSASDADSQYDELARAVNDWIHETESVVSRDPAHEVEFTRGGHMATDVVGLPSARLGALVATLDPRLERLSDIRKGFLTGE